MAPGSFSFSTPPPPPRPGILFIQEIMQLIIIELALLFLRGREYTAVQIHIDDSHLKVAL